MNNIWGSSEDADSLLIHYLGMPNPSADGLPLYPFFLTQIKQVMMRDYQAQEVNHWEQSHTVQYDICHGHTSAMGIHSNYSLIRVPHMHELGSGVGQ